MENQCRYTGVLTNLDTSSKARVDIIVHAHKGSEQIMNVNYENSWQYMLSTQYTIQFNVAKDRHPSFYVFLFSFKKSVEKTLNSINQSASHTIRACYRSQRMA